MALPMKRTRTTHLWLVYRRSSGGHVQYPASFESTVCWPMDFQPVAVITYPVTWTRCPRSETGPIVPVTENAHRLVRWTVVWIVLSRAALTGCHVTAPPGPLGSVLIERW